MKTLFTFSFLLLCTIGFAQDSITDKAGNTYDVKIIEETSTDLTYKVGTGNPITINKKNLKAYAYAPGSRPEKRNNTIIIETTDDPQAAMRKIVSILSDQGYGIQTVDKDLGILTTTNKGFVHGTMTLNLSIRPDSVTRIVIRGTVDSPEFSVIGGLTGTAFNLEYRGMKGSPMMNAWEDMEKVAKAYPEAKVTYATK